HGVLPRRGDRGDDDGAGLDRGGDEPLLDEPPLDDVGGAGEGRVDVAGLERPRVRLVGAEVAVDEGCALGQGGLHVEDGRQRLVLDVDVLERVDGGVPVAGDDGRDAVPDVADLVGGQRLVG